MPLLGSIIHDAPSFEELEKAISKARYESSQEEVNWDMLPDEVRKELDNLDDTIVISKESGAQNNENEPKV